MKQPEIEIGEVIAFIRLHLYNKGAACGATAIRAYMEEHGVVPVPSDYLIKKTLRVRGLTNSRTGIYPSECMEG